VLSAAERDRYLRQIVIPEVGQAGQNRLARASVLIVGVGGLGGTSALYLAAAGVGRIALLDPDVVELSNLQRQILYKTSDISRHKVTLAAQRLHDLNPEVEVDVHKKRLTRQDAASLLQPYDIVLDGTDNFEARYLMNDVCYELGKPYVFGAVQGFDGQATVFWRDRGPCYSCLFPEPPPEGALPGPAEAGVIGVCPGIIATIQATEALKLILGVGRTLCGRVLVYDGLAMDFELVELRQDPDCPVCGDRST